MRESGACVAAFFGEKEIAMVSAEQVGASPAGEVTEVVVGRRRAEVAELGLRCLTCCLGAAAAALVGTAGQVRSFFSVEKRAAFTDMKALVLLVTVSTSVGGYSLLQCLRCAASAARGSALLSKSLAWIIFSSDQALAYAMLGAVAAALQSSMFAERGQPELQWLELCGMYGKFCAEVGGGVAAAVAAGLGLAALSVLSAFNLFRLYGSGKGKMSVAG